MLTSLIQDISVEYATVLIAAVIGAYTFIGGLGATVYVSYFNTAIIYIIMAIFIMKVFNDPDSPDNPLGGYALYHRVHLSLLRFIQLKICVCLTHK